MIPQPATLSNWQVCDARRFCATLRCQPAIRAKVYALRWTDGAKAPKVRAETDKDGRFSFTAPRGPSQLFVTAAGCGPAWVKKPGKIMGKKSAA